MSSSASIYSASTSGTQKAISLASKKSKEKAIDRDDPPKKKQLIAWGLCGGTANVPQHIKVPAETTCAIDVDGGPEFVVDNSHTINAPLAQLINGRQGCSFPEASLAKPLFLSPAGYSTSRAPGHRHTLKKQARGFILCGSKVQHRVMRLHEVIYQNSRLSDCYTRLTRGSPAREADREKTTETQAVTGSHKPSNCPSRGPVHTQQQGTNM